MASMKVGGVFVSIRTIKRVTGVSWVLAYVGNPIWLFKSREELSTGQVLFDGFVHGFFCALFLAAAACWGLFNVAKREYQRQLRELDNHDWEIN